ncbi:MAG: hypothetical protein ACK4PG_08610 [Acetobacteraceae bacterium]
MSGDEGGPWVFASLPNNSVAALLRDLKEAETEGDWNAVMVRIVDELAFNEALTNRIHEYWPEEARRAWEIEKRELRRLVERGFRSPPRAPRQTARAHHDAHTIATWAGARTIAEAVAFLRKAYLLSETEARSRVRLARAVGGLKLVPAPRGGARARNPRPSK